MRALSPNLRCHLHNPACLVCELLEDEVVDEDVGARVKLLLLLLRGPLLLLPRFPPFPGNLPPLTWLMSPSSSSLKACVKGVEEEVRGGEGVAEAVEEAMTLLMDADCFSVGLPWRSKNVSAILATSSDDISSTSFPIISLIREGIVLSRCSRRMWSSSTSLVSSLS